MSGIVLHYEAQRIFRPEPKGMDGVAANLLDRLLDEPAIERVHAYVANDPREGTPVRLSHPKLEWHAIAAPAYPIFEQVLLPRAMARTSRTPGRHVFHFTSNTAPLAMPHPSVVTIHDAIFMSNDPALKGSKSAYQSWGRTYRRLVVPRVARRAEAIVTVSEHERGNLAAAFGVPAAGIHVVHNGVAESHFQPIPPNVIADTRKRLGLDGPFALFFANADPRKNMPRALSTFLRAREAAPGLRLALASVPRQLDPASAAILDGPGRDAFVRLGFVSSEDLRVLFAEARFLLFPSLAEGFGLPVVEAMAHGTAVLTSRTTSLPEVAGGLAELVDPASEDAIVAGIEAILSREETPADRQARIDHARGFRWSAAAAKVAAVYGSIA